MTVSPSALSLSGMEEFSHQAGIFAEKKRLSDYLVGIFPQVPSRKGIKKAIKKGWVSVDGQRGFTGLYLQGGECITLTLPPPPATEKLPNLQLKIVYEDDYLAVVEKPPGLLVSGNKWMTLTNALPANLQMSSQPDKLLRPQPVHRLDYPTSGLLIVGKTANSLIELGKLLSTRQIDKTYLAVVIGTLPSRGTIDVSIDEKVAVSHYVRLARLESTRFGFLNLVRLGLETGRRHQLRIHLASVGCPILGDREYGQPNLILQGKGLYLHAYQLCFQHPESGEAVEAIAEVPRKFLRLFPELTV